jgi:hypothetical protein
VKPHRFISSVDDFLFREFLSFHNHEKVQNPVVKTLAPTATVSPVNDNSKRSRYSKCLLLHLWLSSDCDEADLVSSITKEERDNLLRAICMHTPVLGLSNGITAKFIRLFVVHAKNFGKRE